MSLEAATERLAGLAQALSSQMTRHAQTILKMGSKASTTPEDLLVVVQSIEADLKEASAGWAQIAARLANPSGVMQ